MRQPYDHQHDHGDRVSRSAVLALFIVLLIGSPTSADRASARKLVEDARAMQAGGDDSAALSLCERAIVQDPDYRPAHELATPMWLQRREYGVLIRHFERLTLRDPGYAHGWYTLAYAYRLAGRTSSAIAVYELYIEMRPGRAEPHFGLALSYKKAGRPGDARRAFARYVALERDPGRREFVERATRELALLDRVERPRPTRQPLRGPAIDMNHPQLERAQALIDELRYGSAEAVLARFRAPSAALDRGRTMLRVRLLMGRGRDRAAARLLVDLAVGNSWWNPAVHLQLAGML